MNYDISTKEGMANAIKWQQVLVDQLKDGGTWMVPRSLSCIAIHHSEKLAVQVSGAPEPTIKKVFKAMGWKWKRA